MGLTLPGVGVLTLVFVNACLSNIYFDGVLTCF